MSQWRFDENDPANERYEEDTLPFLPAIEPALLRAFDEILESPIVADKEVVKGEFVYIKRIAASLVGNQVIPALLLGYTVDHSRKLIQRIVLCRASELAPEGSKTDDKTIYKALQGVLELALARAKKARRISAR
jgi:hypothetical protein